MVEHVWICSCGKHTVCSFEDTRLGSIWHCEKCDKTFACLFSKASGSKVWLTLDPAEVKFHQLLKNNVVSKNTENVIEENGVRFATTSAEGMRKLIAVSKKPGNPNQALIDLMSGKIVRSPTKTKKGNKRND